MSITNISQNRVNSEQTNALATKRNASDKKSPVNSESASTSATSQVSINKMSQALGSHESKNVTMDEPEDLSNANFSSSNMMQAHSNKITPEFVASLLDRNPYTST